MLDKGGKHRTYYFLNNLVMTVTPIKVGFRCRLLDLLLDSGNL